MKNKKILEKIKKHEKEISQYNEQQIKEKTEELKKKIQQEKIELEEILPEAYAIAKRGTKIITGKTLYDVQIEGGYILNQGRIAEIKAGEGKTLTAVLPAYLNALEGKGVHIITTNEYLAQRDYNEVGKILEYLGITVGIIDQDMTTEERKKQYQKEVTYGTNTEFGFDYLRDNIARNKEEIVQRELNYAIIDEADSILIDEAQTPMIISNRKAKNDEKPYIKADKFVKSLKGIRIIKENPKDKKQLEENEKYDYVVDETYKTVVLTQKGIKKAEKEYNLKNFYEKENIETINLVKQALCANNILEKDVDYIIKDKNVQIIDKYTGRIMKGKRYTKGLHEAIEAKEGLKIDDSSTMVASITTQNYFKMYKKLSGMTGTAKTAEKELNEIYGLDVVEIPRNLKSKRKDRKDKVYGAEQEKIEAIIKEIKKSQEKGQPVLIGTISIEKSEELSKLLKKENIKHNILNAKNDKEEAQIVEQAGQIGKVTIATNMAGRGTNIIINQDEVIKAGGLKVIGTEKHESRRIDEQLRGRSGRQGQIGESIFYISLEDELIKIYGKNRKIKIKKEIKSKTIKKEIEKAQKEAENKNYTSRKRMVNYDKTLNIQRRIIYGDRKQILEGIFEETIKNFIDYYCEQIIKENTEKSNKVKQKLEEYEKINIREQNLKELEQKIYNRYKMKENEIGKTEFHEIEKQRILKVIDENWIDHLETMEYLKDNIELRVYGGYNPIQEYEKEGKKLFDKLIYKIKMNIINQLLFKNNYIE